MLCVYMYMYFTFHQKDHNGNTNFVCTSTLDSCYTLCKMREEISTFAKKVPNCNPTKFLHTSILELVLDIENLLNFLTFLPDHPPPLTI